MEQLQQGEYVIWNDYSLSSYRSALIGTSIIGASPHSDSSNTKLLKY
ncbi:hypothetical protein [Saccharolobus islandicus]|uniref:Uncharacterized protein n=1 Tax=Saccharolobus islandicus (strain REY15A) TaxID=930945 RepID=F0NDW0_SACI5|nr:hypothetical protein [Sulfolobus islandicus]ADX84669.1 hypothetical protein SiRe_0586 [Sulfolobus islandicus REY15A]